MNNIQIHETDKIGNKLYIENEYIHLILKGCHRRIIIGKLCKWNNKLFYIPRYMWEPIRLKRMLQAPLHRPCRCHPGCKHSRIYCRNQRKNKN